MDGGEIAVEVGEVIVAAIPKLIELFKHGGRDAVLTALDAGLTGARAKTDADLAAKHKGEHGAAGGGNTPAPVAPPHDSSTRDVIVHTQYDEGRGALVEALGQNFFARLRIVP